MAASKAAGSRAARNAATTAASIWHTADVQAIHAAATDDVLAGTVVTRSRVSAAIVHAKRAPAVPAGGDALEQCHAFPHGTSGLMGARTDVFSDPLLVGFESLPIDEARMVALNENGPLGARSLPHAFADSSAFIHVPICLGFPVDIGASIYRVCEDLADLRIGGHHPMDTFEGARLEWEAQAFGAKPKPDTTYRAQLGEAGENRADRGGDGLIGMNEHLAVSVAVDESHGQAAPELAALGLVEKSLR